MGRVWVFKVSRKILSGVSESQLKDWAGKAREQRVGTSGTPIPLSPDPWPSRSRVGTSGTPIPRGPDPQLPRDPEANSREARKPWARARRGAPTPKARRRSAAPAAAA
jgi:hypothetical protein